MTGMQLLKPIRRFLVAILAIVGFATSPTALAWGSDGHKIIAMLADAQLTPAARKEVALACGLWG